MEKQYILVTFLRDSSYKCIRGIYILLHSIVQLTTIYSSDLFGLREGLGPTLPAPAAANARVDTSEDWTSSQKQKTRLGNYAVV